MKFSVEWPRPTDLEQRIDYANICSTELGLLPLFGEVVVDRMDDGFNNAFRSWPTCYYVVGADKRLLYVGDSEDEAPDEGEMYARFDVNQLLDFLRNLK